MEPTSLVQVIREFIDRGGNRYPAREQPYLYGELPAYVRDNKDFVVPVANVVITSAAFNDDFNTKVLSEPSHTRKLKPVVLTSTIVEQPEAEKPVIIEENKAETLELEKVKEITPEVKEETPVIKSRKRKVVE